MPVRLLTPSLPSPGLELTRPCTLPSEAEADSSFLGGCSPYTCPAWAAGGWDRAAPDDERKWQRKGYLRASCLPGQQSLPLLLPVEPSGGLTGLSPGLESETDFWESTVARSWNPKGHLLSLFQV